MIYRKLGKTSIDVSIIGLGAEHLEHSPKDTVTSIVDETIDRGVNYIDLFMASPSVRDNFGNALRNRRQKVIIAGHLGAAFTDGQYYRTRDTTTCEQFFNDLLTRLNTDYIDVLMLHYVDEPDDYDRAFGPGGILELAVRLKNEGKTRCIGMSSHRVPTALRAVNSGSIDVLLFPVNPVYDALPSGAEMEAAEQSESYQMLDVADKGSISERVQLYHACEKQVVGLVAMKPYAAGQLFVRGNPSSMVLTPVQCISYALSQPGVRTVVPGCRNTGELNAALSFLEATDEEKDYSSIRENPVWMLRGKCMYCNHCLPCPVGIDVGTVIRLTDIAEYGLTSTVISEYTALPSKASACNECGVCMDNCPFGVDIVADMARATKVFNE